MAQNFDAQIISKKDYHFAIDQLISNYEKRYRLIPTPSDSKQNQQKQVRLEQVLKEIKALLRQEDLQFRIIFDEDYQSKIRHQILFIKMLITATNEFLESEALENQIKALLETESYLRFKELDEKKREELQIAIERLLALIKKEEREFVLVAILMSEFDISSINIELFHNVKSKLTDSLSNLETSFNGNLHKTLTESELFHHLLVSEINELKQSIKQICDDVDVAYHHESLPKDQHSLTYSKQRHSKQEHELIKYNEKKNKLISFLKKHHHQKPVPIKYKPLDLTDSPQYEKLAELAVQMHQAYVKEKHELEDMITSVDKKIELEEAKKKECLEKVNLLVGPSKKSKYKKIVENTFNVLESRFLKEKERLETKKEEKEIGDKAIKMLHPEIFGDQKIETRKKKPALKTSPAPLTEQDPTKRKWTSHVARKPASKNKQNVDPKAKQVPQKNHKGKK